MHLVRIQIQAPDGSVAGDACGLRGLVRAWFRQEVPQSAGIPSPARLPQLDFCEEPVAAGTVFHQQLPLNKESIIHYRGAQEPDDERGKLLKRSWRWYVLIPQGSKAVVRGDEQVVPGDPGLVVEGRPVRLHLCGEWLPEQLILVRERTPGLQCPLMHRHHRQLALGERELRGYTLPEEAFTVTVISSDTSGRAEGVIDKDIGAKLDHKP